LATRGAVLFAVLLLLCSSSKASATGNAAITSQVLGLEKQISSAASLRTARLRLHGYKRIEGIIDTLDHEGCAGGLYQRTYARISPALRFPAPPALRTCNGRAFHNSNQKSMLIHQKPPEKLDYFTASSFKDSIRASMEKHEKENT